jgi:integrase/recombinase XerD
LKSSNYIKGFKSYLQLERRVSPNTVAAYLHDVKLLTDYLDNNVNKGSIKDVVMKDCVAFISHINEMDIGSHTQSRIISGIKSFFKFLLLEKVITSDPSELIESPKLGRHLPDVLTIDEVDKIIDSVDLSLDEGERNKAILETLYSCGIRVGELINLNISDLHFNEGIIIVTGKGNKQRMVPVGEMAKKHIMIYLNQVRSMLNVSKDNPDILFLNRRGKKLSRQMIFYIVKNHVEKAGIHKNISPHSFRHSYATHLVQNGADLRVVQELLGHVSIITTEIYTHLNREDLRKALLRYHPRNID